MLKDQDADAKARDMAMKEEYHRWKNHERQADIHKEKWM